MSKQHDKEEFLTINVFVNDEYRVGSQSTEDYMIQPGLDFYQFEPEKRIREVAEAAKKFNQKKVKVS